MLPLSLIPANDQERLLALAPYRVLGTSPDVVFDEVVRLVAKLFEVPVALVSLVDEGSVWFKANFGLGGATHVARNESVCSVAILQEQTTVYSNLLAEPCQLTDPGVAEALNMQFYAGHPLRDATGYNLGALCIIGHQPRELRAAEQQRLQALAAIVMQLLELRLALHQRPEQTVQVWIQLYDHLDTSLTRLDTLAELSRWEESPTTPGALRYQQAREEEAALVVQQLAQQVRAALAGIR
ncbi:MAG: GAF domain-containing protein [Cytophagaceae bacterium]|nr:MAG: GAF domain-containing protein [Cytophagaceae bacterium]